MDGPLNKVVGKWTETSCRDPIYVDSIKPELSTYEKFGCPGDDYLCVRIAGTNGKGSTTRFVAWTLEEQGYDVGMMSNTSTTKTLTDTIRYNSEKISEPDLRNICSEVASIGHKDIEPYGIRTVAALEWFKRKDADVVVLESGVGSLFDSTNVVHSEVYAVTNAGEDHINSMGGDEESIVRDFAKAGETAEVLVTNAEKDKLDEIDRISPAPVIQARDRVELYRSNNELNYQCQIDDLRFDTNIKAGYQSHNLNTALEVLNRVPLAVDLASLKSVLSNFRFPGRAELVQDDPQLLLDGAHNIEGIEALIRTLRGTNRNVKTVFTALEDKPWSTMLEELNKVSDSVITTSPQGGSRDTHTEDLKSSSDEYVKNPLDAVQKAKSRISDDGLVLVTGSLYMIKEIRDDLIMDN